MLAQDVIFVSGGNTANLLAIWRAHGFDEIIREAWEQGIVLAGSSAGMICWFEAGVTDSFGPQLEGMRDGLGFLPGSACPHYDGEEQRRPVYTRLVANGFPAGMAADDAVGAALRRHGASRGGHRRARALTRIASSPGTRSRSSRAFSKKSRGRTKAAPSPVTSVVLVEAIPAGC